MDPSAEKRKNDMPWMDTAAWLAGTFRHSRTCRAFIVQYAATLSPSTTTSPGSQVYVSPSKTPRLYFTSAFMASRSSTVRNVRMNRNAASRISSAASMSPRFHRAS